MALIKCDECGREISDRSQFCPGCGFPTHLNKIFTEAKASEPTPEVARPVTDEPVATEKIETESIQNEVEEQPKTAEILSTEEEKEEEEYDISEYYDDEPVNEESNYKKKVTLFLSIFAILAVLVCGLYLYEDNRLKNEPEQSDDTEVVEEASLVSTEAVSDSIQTDTLPEAPTVAPKPNKPTVETSTVAPGSEPTLSPRQTTTTPTHTGSSPTPASTSTETISTSAETEE